MAAFEVSDPSSVYYMQQPHVLAVPWQNQMLEKTYDGGSGKFKDCISEAHDWKSSYQASKDDLTVFSAVFKASLASYVNVSRWYKHIDALLRISGVSGEGSGVTVEGNAPASDVATPPAADSKASAADDDDDDDVDLLGEETEEEKKAAEERAASAAAKPAKKKE
ncbi:hypothetical protein BVRB_016180, partial [Beta vulgaris subsp. vulgaris]